MTAKKPIDIAKTTWLSGCPKSWKLIQFKHLFEITKNSSLQEVPQVLSLTQNGVTERDVSSNEGQLSSDYSQALVESHGFAFGLGGNE
jgi:type I restriction enzyme S subunit